MAASRKLYVEIAKEISFQLLLSVKIGNKEATRQAFNCAQAISTALKRDNPAFSHTRFLEACVREAFDFTMKQPIGDRTVDARTMEVWAQLCSVEA